MTQASELTSHQLLQLTIAARTSAVLSLCGASFTIVSYLSCPALRKPFNRLAFVSAIANAFGCLAYAWAADPLSHPTSAFCQAQGFFIQWFVMTDPAIVFIMAFSLWLRVNARKSLQEVTRFETVGIIAACSCPLPPALTFLFWRPGGVRIFGSAGMWCWISGEHKILRLASFYGPIWGMILGSIFLFILSGRKILRIRAEVKRNRTIQPDTIIDDPTMNFSWNSKPYTFPKPAHVRSIGTSSPPSPAASQHSSELPRLSVVATLPGNDEASRIRRRSTRTRFEAMHWKFARFAILCTLVLFVTWIPISVNRVYNNIVHQNSHPVFGLYFASALCIPLHGIGNFFVYINTSWPEVQEWLAGLWAGLLSRRHRRHADPP